MTSLATFTCYMVSARVIEGFLCLGTKEQPWQFTRSRGKQIAFCLLQQLSRKTAGSQFAFRAGPCFVPEHMNQLDKSH